MPTAAPAPVVYSYQKTDGSSGTTTDQANAPGIAEHSGFQTMPAVQAPVNSMPAEQLGTNPSTYSTFFPPPSASSNLSETAIASKDSYLANLAKEADVAKANQTQSKTTLADVFAKISGQASKKADLYDSGGINQDQKDIDELTSTIESRGRAYDKQIEDIQSNNPEGKLASGVTNEVNRVSRQKAGELADLAIVLNAKTRNFTTAKSIIDTKVDAETEDLKNKLSGLEFFYNENAATLSDDQKTLLGDKIDAANREYAAAKDTRTLIGNVQLEAAKNGAPVSIVRAIGAATDQESAMTAAGGYLKAQNAAGAAYSAADARTVNQAGLGSATQRTKDVFLNTPSDFQMAFIRNGSGSSAATPQNIINSLAEWEAYQASQKNGNGDVDALIKTLQAGG